MTLDRRASSNQEIGSRLKRIRRDLGLTQAELAEQLEVNAKTYQQYESGYMPMKLEVLIRFIEQHQVHSDFLLFGEEYPRHDLRTLRRCLETFLTETLARDVEVPPDRASAIVCQWYHEILSGGAPDLNGMALAAVALSEDVVRS